jgi:nitrogen fixation/metabolism regulation signal transduction histidine kinase
MLMTILLVLLAYAAGVATTVAIGFAIERRVIDRHGGKLELAARLVEDYASEIGGSHA